MAFKTWQIGLHIQQHEALAVAVHKKRERDPKKMRHHVVSHLT